MNNLKKRIALPLGIAVIIALTIAISMAIGSTIYFNPIDFETAATNLGEAVMIDFEDATACPSGTVRYCTPFDGTSYVDMGFTFVSPDSPEAFDDELFIAPSSLGWNLSKSISVFRFPFDPWYGGTNLYNEDDLMVTLDPPCAAAGFTMIDANIREEEYIQFINADGEVIAQNGFPPIFSGNRRFLGLVSPDDPIAKINIVEVNHDTDDVNYDDFICYPVELEIQVTIDIKPGSYPNCFNNDGHGVIPVAILTTDTFDASSVDAFSLSLDGAAASVKGKSGNAGALEDVDYDGDLDLIVQIEDIDGTYEEGDSFATLTGSTYDGIPIVGEDTICIVP